MKKILFTIITAALLSGCSKKEIYPPVNNPGAEIQTFNLVTETGVNAISTVSIDQKENRITVKINPGISPARLFPTAVISEGAFVQPAMGVYTDFSREVTYKVTSGDRQNQKNWTVDIQK